MSHSGHDEEDCIATLEAVRNNMNEGRKLGAVVFYIGGGINIELKLEDNGENIRGLDGIDWYGLHGPECRGGWEDVLLTGKVEMVTAIGCFQLFCDEYLGEYG